MRIGVDTVVTTTLVACALVIACLLLRRELFAPWPPPKHASEKPLFIKGWRADLTEGARIGGADAPVQIIEFGDFECPYCGEFNKNLKIVQKRNPNEVALTFIHFPLLGHRFALPAARVVECAAGQGRFEAMHDQLFERQEDFGLKPWSDYARAAGVRDLAAFDACIKKTDPIPRVEEGKALGARLDVQGTPTIIINGWKLGHPPTEAELDQMVQGILAGKSPIGST